MALSHDSVSMAVFCDFENIALGVRDVRIDKFDIKRVLERLLLKGSIVVKKAYCDWERYKTFKAPMHEASFELIEIPHVRQSGKNSADIRLVVDALDLCYTKSHVDTFVIISGDSDFSPLVSKLRENAKQVIGVGVRQSTSDLLIANCDEFIFYDDLVPEAPQSAPRRDTQASNGRNDKSNKESLERRRAEAVSIAVETFDALLAERGESGKIWASMLKEAIKRRKPDFNESNYGFRAFGSLLEAAQKRGLLNVGRDEKSGAFVYRKLGADDDVSDAGSAAETMQEAAVTPVAAEATPQVRGESGPDAASAVDVSTQKAKTERSRGRRQRGTSDDQARGELEAAVVSAASEPAQADAPASATPQTSPAIVAADSVEQASAADAAATDSAAAKPKRRTAARKAPRVGKDTAASEADVPEAKPAATEPAALDVGDAVRETEAPALGEAPAKTAKPRRRSAPKRSSAEGNKSE